MRSLVPESKIPDMRSTIKESTLRSMVKRLLEDKSLGPAMVSVNNVVDPSAAVTDPSNPNFKPYSRVELQVALNAMIDDVPDNKIPDVYDSMKNALEVSQEEQGEAEMKKAKETKVEESVRLAIRKILNEISKEEKAKKLWAGLKEPTGPLPPVKRVPYGQHGAEYLSNLERNKAGLGKQFSTMQDDEDSKEMERNDMPASGRARKNVMMGDVSGASFKEIAKEMGFAAESGAKQAVERALDKAKFAGSMDPDQLEIITLTAMNDYINMLNKTGELSAADVQLMKDHPNIVEDLDGFREYLDGVLKKVRKTDQKVVNPVK
jgi:hypothetical protein